MFVARMGFWIMGDSGRLLIVMGAMRTYTVFLGSFIVVVVPYYLNNFVTNSFPSPYPVCALPFGFVEIVGHDMVL